MTGNGIIIHKLSKELIIEKESKLTDLKCFLNEK